MKVAIVHYWLVGMRGGERVLEEICGLFPDADIYTHVYAPSAICDTINRHRVRTTFVSRLPLANRHYQKYLPLMPLALEELDLTEYDLIISSEAGPAKGIIPAPDARHICYCHSPMRYIWDQYQIYTKGMGRASRVAFGIAAHRLRQWDVSAAARVDAFVANSNYTASRIQRFYGRPSDVVYPPVDLARFTPHSAAGDYFLCAGQLVPYKRADLAVQAFKSLKAPLLIVGDGPERKRLQKDAPDNVTFLGRVSDDELANLYADCRALIFPATEDFGIVPLEAMASGRPVIAYGRGGACDTVDDGRTGIFFHEQTAEALTAAIRQFELTESAFDPHHIAKHASAFSSERFRNGFMKAVDGLFAPNEPIAFPKIEWTTQDTPEQLKRGGLGV